MSNPAKPSASVIAAGVVAILGGLLVLLSCSAGFVGLLLSNLPANTPELPSFAKTMTLAMMGFFMCLSLFGIASGIGLILLRNWARISALIWGGLCVFFGAVGIPFAFLLPKISPPNAPELPESTERLVQWTMVFVYGLPLIIGVWWLILFNRKSVKAQFTGGASLTEAALPEKPRCPLPVTVLAWLYVTAILNLVFLPFFPVRIPVFVFGLVLPEKAGLVLLLLSAVGFFAGGVGLLKLKPWGYSVTIGLQMFWLASTAVSLLSPKYNAAMTSYMRDFQAWMRLPETQFSAEFFVHQFGWIMKFGLLVGGAVLGILVYYRPRFLAAASAARAPSG